MHCHLWSQAPQSSVHEISIETHIQHHYYNQRQNLMRMRSSVAWWRAQPQCSWRFVPLNVSKRRAPYPPSFSDGACMLITDATQCHAGLRKCPLLFYHWNTFGTSLKIGIVSSRGLVRGRVPKKKDRSSRRGDPIQTGKRRPSVFARIVGKRLRTRVSPEEVQSSNEKSSVRNPSGAQMQKMATDNVNVDEVEDMETDMSPERT